MPYFWTKEEQSLLKGTWVIERVNSDLNGVIDDYNTLFPMLNKVIII